MRRRSFSDGAASLLAALLYPLFLIVSALFVLPIALFQQAIAVRGDVGSQARIRALHRVRRFVFVDVTASITAYLAADWARCRLWMHRDWPEIEPSYGSTLGIHAAMLIMLMVIWPAILYWHGWYQPRWRSLRWRIRNTAAAAVILGFTLSAVALMAFREIYPRIQIGLMILLLPLFTGLIRTLMEVCERPARARRDCKPLLDPAW